MAGQLLRVLRLDVVPAARLACEGLASIARRGTHNDMQVAALRQVQGDPCDALRLAGGTIEERILKLQEKKSAIFEGTGAPFLSQPLLLHT